MGITNQVVKRLAKRVKEFRIARGLSQETLASKAGLHRTYIGMIERSEKNATISSIDGIAKALGVKIRDLID